MAPYYNPIPTASSIPSSGTTSTFTTITSAPPARPLPSSPLARPLPSSALTRPVPSGPPVPSSSPVQINLALNALDFLGKHSSQKEFCRAGGVDPFQSIHSIHLFIRWLSSLPIRKVLSSELYLVAWAVKGMSPGLRVFLRYSLGFDRVPDERINLEYLCWHLEMWREIFSLVRVVEYAREKGKDRETYIVDWYADGKGDKDNVRRFAREYWNSFSGKEDEPMPFPRDDPNCPDYVPR